MSINSHDGKFCKSQIAMSSVTFPPADVELVYVYLWCFAHFLFAILFAFSVLRSKSFAFRLNGTCVSHSQQCIHAFDCVAVAHWENVHNFHIKKAFSKKKEKYSSFAHISSDAKQSQRIKKPFNSNSSIKPTKKANETFSTNHFTVVFGTTYWHITCPFLCLFCDSNVINILESIICGTKFTNSLTIKYGFI